MTRYAITHIGKDGLRTLTFPNQGRHMFDSMTAAVLALMEYRTVSNPFVVSLVMTGTPRSKSGLSTVTTTGTRKESTSLFDPAVSFSILSVR